MRIPILDQLSIGRGRGIRFW